MESDLIVRKKKLIKKTKKGEVHTRQCYDECKSFGIEASPEIIVVDDKTRKQAKYDFRLQDVRELVASILFDFPLPKLFQIKLPLPIYQIKNRPFIRNICHIHVSNCENFLPILDILRCTKGYSTRISNSPDQAIIFPEKLLSLSSEELGITASSATSAVTESESGLGLNVIYKPDFEYYVLSESVMRLWGYPLPVKESRTHSTDIDTQDMSPMKKQRFHENVSHRIEIEIENPTRITNTFSNSIEMIGIKVGTCPSIEETTEVFHRSIDILSYMEVQSKDNQSTTHGYLQTIPIISTHNLYPSSYSIESIPQYPKIIGIDCEMCLTAENGSELTRITLIDQYNRIVLDTFVKPFHRITDYLTSYSGITESDLKDVNITLQQVQLMFLRIVSEDTILVGHSLDSDLRALKICHRKCIDTAILYPHPKSYPYRHKLKYLAEEFLKLTIQRGKNGHDSIEDARTAMQLIILKQESGPSFGMKGVSERQPLLMMTNGNGNSNSSDSSSSSGSTIITEPVLSGFFWNNPDEAEIMMKSCVPPFGRDRISMITDTNTDNLVRRYCDYISQSRTHDNIEHKTTESSRTIDQVLETRIDHEIIEDSNVTSSSTTATARTVHHPLRYIYLGIDNSTVSSNLISTISGVLSKVKETLIDNKKSIGSSLILVTTQPTKSVYEGLRKRKKACQSPQVMAVWTPELELQLRENLSYYHTGKVYMGTV